MAKNASYTQKAEANTVSRVLNTQVQLEFPTTQKGYDDSQDDIIVKMGRRAELRNELSGLQASNSWESSNDDTQEIKKQIGILTGQIDDLKIITKHAVFIEDMYRDPDTVGIGRIVTLFNSEIDEEYVITILGPRECVPDKEIFSYDGGLAKELEGKQVGETVFFNNTALTIRDIKLWQPETT